MEQTRLRPFVFLHLVSSNISLDYVFFKGLKMKGLHLDIFQFCFEANNGRMGGL